MADRGKRATQHATRQTVVLAAIGLAFVLGSFTLMLREAFSGGKSVAELTIDVDEILPSSHGYLVSLVIRNTGAATASALVVEGVLRRAGAHIETSLVTVDYVPAGSRRDVALFFSNDPSQGELLVRPKGYVEP